MTVNQIILLLDIYRGTNTQNVINTRVEDRKALIKLNLISEHNNYYNITDEGIGLCKDINQFILDRGDPR